jgi:hypothetical protein
VPQAVEITRRRLTIDDFVAANADMNRWLTGQPGFVSRHSYAREDGCVVDLLVSSTAAMPNCARTRRRTRLRHARRRNSAAITRARTRAEGPKLRKNSMISMISGGDGGIRTLGTSKPGTAV